MKNIVFYDGVCGLCHRSVQFLMRIDQNSELSFAPLQGRTADQVLGDLYKNTQSIVFHDSQGKNSDRSTAVLNILIVLKGPWKWLAIILKFLPPSLRDSIYDLVAKSRYRIFGKYENCRLPKGKKSALLP